MSGRKGRTDLTGWPETSIAIQALWGQIRIACGEERVTVQY